MSDQLKLDQVTTGRDPDEGTPDWYRRMFKVCEVRKGHEIQVHGALALILRGMTYYLSTARSLHASNAELFGAILGVIHFKEATCDFRAALHNGDRIIGTGKKTWQVPRGRGPFVTWEQGAIDAITMNAKRWESLLKGSNDIGLILYALERYNGTGYISGAGKQETSPYLWACSNINDGSGKYTVDHGFDPNATTLKTVGAALLLKELQKAGKISLVV